MQAAPGPAGRVEPTCSFRATSTTFVQPVLRAFGDVMHGGIPMNPLPDRLNLDHLKKQAKQLIRLYRSRDAAAMARFRSTLPAAAGLGDAELSSRELRLHDAQSCIAREHGFASWPDLKLYVEVQAVAQQERAVRVLHWAQLIYAATSAARQAAPICAWHCGCWRKTPGCSPAIPGSPAPSATNDALRQATQADPAWVNRSGGPLQIAAAFRHCAFRPAAGRRISRAACTDARIC